MRALLLDENTKGKVKRVRDWAEEPTHYYRPGISETVPGDDPLFHTTLDYGFRCVFTITVSEGIHWRHLSISVDGKDYANPWAALTIADLFGFEGWDAKSNDVPESWQAAVNRDEHCIVLMQPFTDAKVAA